jgi:hypothetical protein
MTITYGSLAHIQALIGYLDQLLKNNDGNCIWGFKLPCMYW